MSEQTPYEAFLKLDTGTHTARIQQLLVTPDGKSLITSGGDKTIRVWDVASKKQERMLLGEIGRGADGSIQAITISRDGKYVVALVWRYPDASQDANQRETDFRVYELATGNLTAGYRYPGTLQDLDFSLDGKYIALTGNPNATRQGSVLIYETKKITSGFGTMPSASAIGNLLINDLIPSYVRFIPEKQGADGSYRVVAASWQHWRSVAPEYSGRLYWFSLSPSKKLEVLIDREIDDQIAPNSLTTSSQFAVVTAEALSEDKNKKIYCYDHNGQLVHTVDSETLPANPAFSRDENQLIVGQREDSVLVQIKVYDTAFGKFPLKSTYFSHDSAVLGTALLDDGLAVSAGGDQNVIHFWSTTHMEGEKVAEINGVGRVLHVVGISSDEQIGFGYRDDLRLKDGTMVLQRAFDLRSLTLKSFPFQEADNFHRSQKTFGNETLDFSEGSNWNLRLLPRGPYFSSPLGWYNVSTFGFTTRGSVVAGSPDGKVRLTLRGPQGYQGMRERYLVGHEAAVLDHAASDRWLVTVGADQVIRLWFLEDAEQENLSELHPALNLFAGSDDDWVLWSKSGYYLSSDGGDRRLGFHINRGNRQEAVFIPSDRFIKLFFRPDIIRAIVETGSEERALAKLKDPGITRGQIARFMPPIIDLVKDIAISRNQKSVTIDFSVTELISKNKVSRVWIVQNNHFAAEFKPNAQKRYQAKLQLTPGANQFKILAETENSKSVPFFLDGISGPQMTIPVSAGASKGGKDSGQPDTATPPSKPGTLFLLAVGVAQLENEDPANGYKSLTYPGADAMGIYNALARSAFSDETPKAKAALKNKAFESVDATYLINEEATKENIIREAERICKTIRMRAQASDPAHDVLLVFLSGHGVRVTGGPNPDLYFWNYDTKFDKLLKTGLSFIELGKIITSVEADIILATDACHSGIAGSDVVSGLDPTELAKRIYAINERGLYVLNAARGDEEAREFSVIKHGVFTRSILDALREDSSPDMSMMRLMDSVQRRMFKYTLRQTPVFRTYGDLLPLTIYTK